MIKRFRKSKPRYPSQSSQYIIILSLIVVLLFLVVADFRLLAKRIKTDNQVKILRKKADDLASINKDLQNKLNASLDKNYVEKVLREKGVYKKPNEEAIVVLPPQENTSTKSTSSKSFWRNSSFKLFFSKIRESIKRMFKISLRTN